MVIEAGGSTNYSAYAPDLPGVVATGDTLEQAEAAMREAIEFHIEGLRLAGELDRRRRATSRSSPSLRKPSVSPPSRPCRNFGCVIGAAGHEDDLLPRERPRNRSKCWRVMSRRLSTFT
jgi:predicted RNase H-like HicB family nuclease